MNQYVLFMTSHLASTRKPSSLLVMSKGAVAFEPKNKYCSFSSAAPLLAVAMLRSVRYRCSKMLFCMRSTFTTSTYIKQQQRVSTFDRQMLTQLYTKENIQRYGEN